MFFWLDLGHCHVLAYVDLCLLVFNDDSDEVTCGWLELLICGDRGSGMDML